MMRADHRFAAGGGFRKPRGRRGQPAEHLSGVCGLDGRADARAFQRNALWGSEEAGGRYGDRALGAVSAAYHEIMAEPGYIAGILREGAARVRPIADSTVDLVKQRMGLYTES